MNKIAAYNAYQTEQSTDNLILDNLPLVKSIALHLHCRLPKHILLDDLIQSGIVGLVEAARRYQREKGVTFNTFASQRIRGAIIDDLRRNDELPRSMQAEAKKMQKVINFIEQSEGRAAHDAEIAYNMQVSMDEYENLLQAMNAHYSLSTDEIDIVDEDHIENQQPMQHVQRDEIKAILSEQLAQLPEKEKLILALYYNEELNFKEIGDVLDVSESRISQLHGQAMTRLKARLNKQTVTQDEST